MSSVCRILGLAGLVAGAIDEHLITSLPGFNVSTMAPMYSGYIDVPYVNGTVHVHYWYVQNAAGKSDAPTVVWQQGGPGGSSLIGKWIHSRPAKLTREPPLSPSPGLFTENGPITLNDYSVQTAEYKATGIPSVFANPNSWHTSPANMVYVEHPAPTGFSYCDGECNWDDWNQAIVNYGFYVEFFAAYPELSDNDFFFTGESYAGVLVPTVSLQIANHTTDANKHKAPWNLGGFMLGNDCPGNHIYTCTPYSGWIGTQVAVDFRFRHGMISEDLYARINKVRCKFTAPVLLVGACRHAFAQQPYSVPPSLVCHETL
jgi:carboxypeptidase C (cathepsin A)